MFTMIKSYRVVAYALFVFLLSWGNAFSQDVLIPSDVTPGKLNMTLNKSMILKFADPVKKKLRIAVGDPQIVDYRMLSSREIYLNAKKPGSTNLILWEEDDLIGIYEIQVSLNVSSLKEMLYQSFPEEKDIQVVGTNESITLLGRVSNAEILSKIVTMAEAFSPKTGIKNLLQAGGTHQVMLEVQIAEMSRSVGKDLAFDVIGINDSGDLGMTLLSPLHTTTYDGGSTSSTYSSAVNALFKFSKGSTSWTAFIQALQEDGLAKILAKPNLVSLNGQTASFLAGGEFPIPVTGRNGDVTIEFKEFGVGLQFTPTVLNENRMSITVDAKVSELDFSTSVNYTGYVYPGLTTRQAATTIQLNDGQSFAIAGLLRETTSENVKKFPFLGDIPLLGTLFKSTSFQKNESELVIIVTPRFVKPQGAGKNMLPTDNYQEPDNWEHYLNLKNIRPRSDVKALPVGETDGQFGHAFENEK